MRLKLVAHTIFIEENAKDFGYIPQWEYLGLEDIDYEDDGVWEAAIAQMPKTADELAEFAGRNCYQAWERKNPETQTNASYIRNILNQKHYSVLEHASATIVVDGCSVAMLGQLSRHRHFSFSVLSQRFVNKSGSKIAPHPGLRDYLDESIYPANYEYPFTVREVLEEATEAALHHYEELFKFLTDKGLNRKQAREAARTVLPQGIETCIVLTGNMRAWREFLQKRNDEHADAEIHEFAREALVILKAIAPNTFQDME